MKLRIAASMMIAPLALTGAATSIPAATADSGDNLGTYRVTVINATTGQPFSPPIAATHRKRLNVFHDGPKATPALADIAQSGDTASAAMALESHQGRLSTDVVEVGQPLAPAGVMDGPFPNTVSFDIEAAPRDRFSLATMLICTNDGVTGVDRVRLPREGSKVFKLRVHDAGVERNTQRSADLPDACSALGPHMLAGDDNGNENGGSVMTNRRIMMHKGIKGHRGQLSAAHDWGHGPVGAVTVTRVS